MKSLLTFVILLVSAVFASGQDTNSNIVEKDILVKDWTYKIVGSNANLNLRSFARDKKFVMVAYVSPQCENWDGDLRSLKSLYKDYHSKGLELVAIVEPPSNSTLRTEVESWKTKFPLVYGPESSSEQQNPFRPRCIEPTTGAKTNSPWGIFLKPETFEKDGETITTKAFVINGGAVWAVDDHVRKELGLKPWKGPKRANPILQILCIFCQ